MWIYEKKLEYPVKIKNPDPRMAKVIITQYGGPDGELAASIRYLSQRFSMVTPEARATLNDIGTEELAHLEMVGTMVYQLIKGASIDEIKAAGLDPYYADHDRGIYPIYRRRATPSRRRIFNPRATRLWTFMKTWPPSRRPGQPTNGL